MSLLLRNPEGRVLWRHVLLSWLLLAVAAGLSRTSGATAALASQILVTGAWLVALRFVLADTALRWLWLGWFLFAGAMAAVLGKPGMIAAVSLSGFGLTVRRYRPWRRVSPRLRAAGFGLGLLALVLLLITARGFWTEEATGLAGGIRDLGGWSVGSLAFFWAWSLFHLAIRMQLHFIRLRPKLAISAFLIGFVPLVLVVVLGATILYTGMGGSRAGRTRAILESWRAATAAGSDLAPAYFDTTFTWPDQAARAPIGTAVRLPAPAWMPDLSRRLAASPADSGLAARDTTAWFAAGGNLWLMRWQDVGTPDARADAWLLGARPLVELSRTLRCGIVLAGLGHEREGATIAIGSGEPVVEGAFTGRRAMYRDVADSAGFWADWHTFGGTLLPVIRHRDGRMDTSNLFISLRTSWTDLRGEFLEGEDNINVIVVGALSLLAFLFLVIEIFALFFGVRITEGIISAVRALGRGTERVAAGDLDTRIDVPNEDELGDLAASFNGMIAAVRKGRDDALARERLTRELQTAREIQERLLPHEEPRLPGFEVTGTSIPSREIGGDYFDFLLQGEEGIGIAIGDVSGKGMPAALLMANLQASLHGQVIHPSSVAEVVGRVNDLLVASTDPHMFATFFYGVLDIRRGVFTTTNAGHNPPLLLRADGTLATLGDGGLLLGMLEAQPYRQQETEIGPGDVVVLYTDGITEAVGPAAEADDPDAMFGEEALAAVRRHAHLPALGIKEAILAAVADHTAGVEQSDDITLVVIRRQD